MIDNNVKMKQDLTNEEAKAIYILFKMIYNFFKKRNKK